MRSFIAFVKKEIIESIRTYRLFILLTVFFIFGVSGPLLAKMMPDIVGSLMPSGMFINIPKPAAIDSWTQFYKNIGQVGLALILIVSSGVLTREISKGTLINMLTKGFNRSSVILAKFTGIVFNFTLSILLAFAISFYYTSYLFERGETSNLLLSVFCLWLFGVFLLSVLLFGESLIKSSYGGLLFTVLIVIILVICNLFSYMKKYNPMSLTNGVGIITNNVSMSGIYTSITVSIGLTVAFLIGSILIFKKRQL